MSESNQFKGLPSRADIFKFAVGCGLATRTLEPSERLYQFAEKLIGYACQLRKQQEDGETFMRQRDTAYEINRELRQQLEQAEQNCRERIKAERLHWLKNGDEFAQQMAERLEQAEARVAELESALRSVIQDLRDRANLCRGERVLPLSSGTYLKAMDALSQQATEIEKGGSDA